MSLSVSEPFANPTGQGRAVEFNAISREDLALAIQRQVVGVFPECLLAVCWEGQKRSREIMPAFLALLWTRIDLETCSIVPDQLMPDEFIDGIPCWAFDMHVREGNRALAKFLDTDAETSRWLRDRVPTNERRGDRTNRIFGTRPLSPVSGCVGNNHMNAGENSPLIDICNRFQIWAHRRSLVPHRCHPFHTLECATFVCYTF